MERDTTCRGMYERDRNTVICAECFNKVDADERLDSQWNHGVRTDFIL